MKSGDYKLASFMSIITTGELGERYSVPIIRSLHNFFYFYLSLKVIFSCKKYIKNEASNIDEMYHRWLIFFVSFLWIPTIAVTLFTVSGFDVLPLEGFYFSVFLFLVSTYLFILYKPAVFHVFPHQMPK